MHVVKLKWAADESLPYTWDWPVGVPKDYAALARDYEKFVVAKLKRYNKIKRNFEDLLGVIWVRLIENHILEMFVEPTARTLPETMTVAEAIQFLGLNEIKWFDLMRRPRLRVKPLKGDHLSSMTTVLATEDIIRLGQVCVKAGIEQGPKKRPALSSRGFRAYLEKAIHNAYVNFCRTQSRRYKEQLLCPQAILSRQSSGVYRQVTELEGGGSWEANMATAVVLDEEDTIDLIRAVRKSGAEEAIKAALADPCGTVPEHAREGVALADLLSYQGGRPEQSTETLELIRQGKSLGEAVRMTVRRERFRMRMRTA